MSSIDQSPLHVNGAINSESEYNEWISWVKTTMTTIIYLNPWPDLFERVEISDDNDLSAALNNTNIQNCSGN